jgi:hypothetical protein
MVARAWIAVLTITLFVFSLTPDVAARGDLEIRKGTLGLRAAVELGISRRTGTEVLKEAAAALKRIDKLYDLDESGIFFLKTHAPWWMPDRRETESRITLTLCANVTAKERGYSAYLGRMSQGALEVRLPIPGEESLTPEERFRIRTEVAEAAFAQSFHGALPLWLRRGLPLVIAVASGKDPIAEAEALRAFLTENVATLNAHQLVSATKTVDSDAAGGATASWALIRLLTESDDDLVQSVLTGCWSLSTHMAKRRTDQALLTEFTEVVIRQLEGAEVDLMALSESLQLWVKAGFPEGRNFRSSEVAKRMRGIKRPPVYGVGITSKWLRKAGSGITKMDSLQFSGGHISWRLPWEDASVDAVAALTKEGGVNYLRNRRPAAARGWESGGPWKGKANGKVRLRGKSWVERRLAKSWGVLLVRVSSPRGTEYIWFEETPIR